jgi:hypothetical protein
MFSGCQPELVTCLPKCGAPFRVAPTVREDILFAADGAADPEEAEGMLKRSDSLAIWR